MVSQETQDEISFIFFGGVYLYFINQLWRVRCAVPSKAA